MCAKDQFTVNISQFTVNVYVRPDKVEIYMQFKKTVQNTLWIGRCSARDQCLMPWPPRSPDVTPQDYVKDSVYVLPLPQSIEELKDRISAAIETISADLLDKVHSCLSKKLLPVLRQGGGILKMNKAFIFISN